MDGNKYGLEIWGATGEAEAKFEGCPAPPDAPIYDMVTCILTVNNQLRWVNYGD